MKKEYVVRSIDAAPDGAPYVIVSLSSVKDLKEGGTQNPQSPFRESQYQFEADRM